MLLLRDSCKKKEKREGRRKEEREEEKGSESGRKEEKYKVHVFSITRNSSRRVDQSFTLLDI